MLSGVSAGDGQGECDFDVALAVESSVLAAETGDFTIA